MYKLILPYLFACVISLAIIGCNGNRNYQTGIDNELQKIILTYIAENDIDVKSKIVVTQWVVTPNDRTDIYISNANSQIYKDIRFAPSYYSIIEDEVVVFIYSNIEPLIIRESADIVDEVDAVLASLAIDLPPDTGNFYHAPTWWYSSCLDNGQVIKKIHPLEYNFVPCGYAILQDSAVADSLKLIKIK